MRVIHSAAHFDAILWEREERKRGWEGSTQTGKKKIGNKEHTLALLLHPKSLFLTFPPSRHLRSMLALRYWITLGCSRYQIFA